MNGIYVRQLEELSNGWLRVVAAFTPPFTNVGERIDHRGQEYVIRSVKVKSERNIFGGKKETAIIDCAPSDYPSGVRAWRTQRSTKAPPVC